MVTVDFHDIEAPGLLTWLQAWYASMCDGDWEQDKGITLETLDNPGWNLTISLSGTVLDGKPFDRIKVERDEHDWIHAWVADGEYKAACGPTNLSEALFTFREWVAA
jgi:hypothetical protein